MKGLRKIPRVSWSAKTTDEWVLNKAGVNRELSDTVKARKLAYYGHTMRKQRSCLEKEIMQGTMPGAQRRGRPRTQTEGEHESSSRHNRSVDIQRHQRNSRGLANVQQSPKKRTRKSSQKQVSCDGRSPRHSEQLLDEKSPTQGRTDHFGIFSQPV